MAKFDERMPLTDGTNRVIDDPDSPSWVGAAADFATQALTGYMNLTNDMRSSAAAKKKADEDAAQASIAYEVAGSNDRSTAAVANARSEFLASLEPADVPVQDTGSLANDNPQITVGPNELDGTGVFSAGAIEASPVLRREVSVAAQRAANFKAAEEQGKIPSISFTAAMNADFRRLRDKYPDQVPFIIKMYKDMGIDAGLFPEAKDAADEHNFQRESGQKRVEEAEERNEQYISTAIKSFGPVAATWSREQQIVQGMQAEHDAFELARTGEQMRINRENRELTDKDRKTNQEELDKRLAAGFSRGAFNASQPFVKMMGDLANGLMTDPGNAGLVERFANLGVMANQGVERYVSASISVARQQGYTGDYGRLESEIRQTWKPILDLFSGDHSVVKAKIDSLKSIETSLKIDTATALPLYTSLTAAGFDVKALPQIMQGLESDKEMMTALSGELKGFRQDMLSDGGSTRLRRIIGILRGEDSLQYAKPGQLAKELPTLVNVSRNLARAYVRNPKDVNGNHVLNAIGDITTQVRTLGPSNSPSTFYVATRSFAGNDVRQALINSLSDGNVDKEMAVATVQASRAGSAQMLNYYRNSASRVNSSSPYFKIVWDSANGKYAVDSSGRKAAMAKAAATHNNFGGPSSVDSLRRMAIPNDVEQFIKGANVNLENAIELGKHDPSTPNASEIDLRNWYGQERPLKVKGQEKINPEQELNKMFEKAEQAIDQLRTSTSSTTISAPNNFREAEGYAQHAPVVKAAAQTHGVPVEIAEALIGKESTFNPNAKGPVIKEGTHKGDRAMGLGQVMAKTAAAYGVTDRASLNPAEQADLAMRVLSDNYKNTGSWKDAISMYFTGVKYDKAVAQGRSDGFNSVMQYVEDIL